MDLLPSIYSLKEILKDKEGMTEIEKRAAFTKSMIEKGLCPLCRGKLRQDARWMFCYRPTVHDIFRCKRTRRLSIKELASLTTSLGQEKSSKS